MKVKKRKVNGTDWGIKFGVISHKGVRKSLNFLWNHCHQPVSVPVLTKVSGMSERGIHQAFMRHLGRSPGRVLREMRIQRTKELLVKFDYKIRVVAAMVGYRRLNSFEVAFKNATGLSPMQFQGNWRYANSLQQQNRSNVPTLRNDELLAGIQTAGPEVNGKALTVLGTRNLGLRKRNT